MPVYQWQSDQASMLRWMGEFIIHISGTGVFMRSVPDTYASSDILMWLMTSPAIEYRQFLTSHSGHFCERTSSRSQKRANAINTLGHRRWHTNTSTKGKIRPSFQCGTTSRSFRLKSSSLALKTGPIEGGATASWQCYRSKTGWPTTASTTAGSAESISYESFAH